MITFEELIKLLNGAKKVAVFCHVRPDGDALGSGLALCTVLQNMGKTAYLCCEDDIPEKFMYIPAMQKIVKAPPQNNYDLYVSVDCADLNRMGANSKRYKNFKNTTINIDHHISNTSYAKFNYIRECSATCEIMTELFLFAGYEITEEIANLLMLGLITDSGNFTHCDVSENTYKMAAELRACGADPNLINYNMYSRQSKARALLYGRCMAKMRFAYDDRFAYIVISAADMEELGADKSLTEGFVDFPLTIDGVEVSASVLEFKKNQYKVSLRSKGKVNVNSVASSFGGGGHVLASGCMILGELEEVIDRLSYAVFQNL